MFKFIRRLWAAHAERRFERKYEGVMRPVNVAKKYLRDELWVVDTPFQQKWRQEDSTGSFGSHGPEIGDIIWVMSEFSESGLYFPFWNSRSRKDHHQEHAHSFAEVLNFLADDPAGFSVDEFKSFYSEQELEFLAAVKRRYAKLDREDALQLKK